MENLCNGSCPLESISWLWLIIATIVSFGVGAFWYGLLFSKAWLKAVRYECNCGANLAKGEKCTCESKTNTILTFLFQLIATVIVVFMYFVLTNISIWFSIVVCIAVCGWMKAALKFEIANWKRFITLAGINVGYFFIVSIIAILFALI